MEVTTGGGYHDNDDVSVMTPITNLAAQQQRAPPQGLDFDDDGSRDLTVFEAEDGTDGSWGAVGGDGLSSALRLRPSSKSNLFPSAAHNTTRSAARIIASAPIKNNVATASSKRKGKISRSVSWLTQTKFFQDAIDSSFGMIDADKSGDVTLEELYAGLLLIHLKMAVYVGPPACRPASKSYVSDIFDLLDTDNSGTLTKDEFAKVMKILYSQVFTRIVIHWLLVLMIVPLVTQYIIKYSTLLYWISHEFWKDIDDNLDPIQRLLWKIWAIFLYFTPRAIDNMGSLVVMAFGKVPKGVLKSMPYTILTLGQTSIALPYALNRVEDFFRRAALSDVGIKGEGRGRVKES